MCQCPGLRKAAQEMADGMDPAGRADSSAVTAHRPLGSGSGGIGIV
jgi:hypothetical protein